MLQLTYVLYFFFFLRSSSTPEFIGACPVSTDSISQYFNVRTVTMVLAARTQSTRPLMVRVRWQYLVLLQHGKMAVLGTAVARKATQCTRPMLRTPPLLFTVRVIPSLRLNLPAAVLPAPSDCTPVCSPSLSSSKPTHTSALFPVLYAADRNLTLRSFNNHFPSR